MFVTTRIKPDDVKEQPFPYVVVRNALDPSMFRSLLSQMPSVEELSGSACGNNERTNYSATRILAGDSTSELWSQFVKKHLSQQFLADWLRIFAPFVLKSYPDFESRFGSLSDLTSGIRGENKPSDKNILLDVQIAANTPVTYSGTTVRGPHIDDPKKLFIGLLYLRLDQDSSRGGDLEIYRSKRGPLRLDSTRTAELADMELVERVAYEQNVLVLMLNTPQSLHGVTPRFRTPYHRLFVNFLGELPRGLFELPVNRFSDADLAKSLVRPHVDIR